MSSPARLPRKPEALTQKVEDLVERVLRGQVRVPSFQRGLKWERSHVVELFDSVYRGYPIGSLLFYKQLAKAERLRVGPLIIDAPEDAGAWWVVDGQQRVTALTACLARPVPIPTIPNKQDPFVLYFDPENQRFEPPPVSGTLPASWVPLPYLLDASRLTEWVFRWHHGEDQQMRRAVFEAGTRIREYPIPLYLIETEGREVATQIFYRVNQAGKPLDWTEVHKALFGEQGPSPSTLAELSDELSAVGMGRFNEDRLLTCLFALRGLDPTKSLAEHYRRDPESLRDAVLEAHPVLRRVLSFLRADAEIPHLRLLPKSILLDVLTRFFTRHSDPSARTRILLTRWFWRTVLGAGSFDDRTLRRRGIKAVVDDEEESAQRLLALVHKERPRSPELPTSFDARADGSRIVLLALVHLVPRYLVGGQPIDVAGLVEEQDKAAFAKILPLPKTKSPLWSGPANRILQPKETLIREVLLELAAGEEIDDRVLSSHAIDAHCVERLAADDEDGFLARRAELLTDAVRHFSERMAAWGHSDRPSVDYLLEEAGVEV